MKTKILTHGRILGLLAVIAFGTVSCEDSILHEETNALQPNKVQSGAVPSALSAVCGEQTFDLFAGQSNDVGSVTVANDDENVYVTYSTEGDWTLTETHLYVLDYVPTGRLAPGQAPYKSGIIMGNSFTFTVPIESCGSVVYLQAHASVIKLNQYGEVISSETAYGGDITKPKKGSWFGTIAYYVECCVVEPPVECTWNGETAFGGTTAGEGKAWWFAFDTNGASVQPIYAGQNEVEGAFVSYENGVITIVLGDNLRPNESTEAVKVQGYDVLPSVRPSAGLFTLYKGRDLTISGDGSLYYVIHLDVEVKNCEPILNI